MIQISGVINGTAPNPVRLGEMCKQLGSVLGRPSWLPVPDLALKAVLGEGASVVRISYSLLILCFVFVHVFSLCFFWLLNCSYFSKNMQMRLLQVLEGQKVVPARAKELGFPFRYAYVKDALRSIVSQ